MIPFLIGFVFSLSLAAAGYLIFRLRLPPSPSPRPPVQSPPTGHFGKVVDLAREQTIAINPETGLKLSSNQDLPFPQDLMNLESAIDLNKVFPDGPPSRTHKMRGNPSQTLPK